MSEAVWKPHVVVAAVIERDDRFLLVEEETSEGVRFNQPRALVGVYRWRQPARGRTYMRFAFTGTLTGFDPEAKLDAGIVRTVWMTPEEIRANAARHRSPMLARCLEDYLAGKSYPLDLLTDFSQDA